MSYALSFSEANSIFDALQKSMKSGRLNALSEKDDILIQILSVTIR